MEDNITEKGKLILVKLWNENRKNDDELVRERAIEMLHNAFYSPIEMITYFKKNNIEYKN